MNDAELRAVFAQEADMLLAQLSAGALELESGTADAASVDSLFRAAHTLKGSAALVRLHEVSTVTHALEDLLEGLRSQALTATPPVVDVILDTVDALREAIPRLLAGEPVGVVDPELVRRLTEAVAPEDRPGTPAAPRPSAAPAPPPAAPSPPPSAGESVSVPL
ncbi:MAG: CheA signal transduction histidine kinase, partial [Solirubrobacterales bacterium]|nr:CheA signal transduction histidine kinase [Solirubrobacterales bacterium]